MGSKTPQQSSSIPLHGLKVPLPSLPIPPLSPDSLPPPSSFKGFQVSPPTPNPSQPLLFLSLSLSIYIYISLSLSLSFSLSELPMKSRSIHISSRSHTSSRCMQGEGAVGGKGLGTSLVRGRQASATQQLAAHSTANRSAAQRVNELSTCLLGSS